MIFQYNNIPTALLPIIKERIESCKDYFPNWCQKVVVEYNSPPNVDFELSCDSEYKYRFILITITEEFFRNDNWTDAVLHEIQHAISAPFTTQIWMIVETLIDEGPLRKYLEMQLREAEEAFATDSANLLDKILLTKDKKS